MHFFEGLYDEIAIQGLPINDRVPLAPVRYSSIREASRTTHRKIANALLPLAGRSFTEVAMTWLRRSVEGLVTGPVALYRP